MLIQIAPASETPEADAFQVRCRVHPMTKVYCRLLGYAQLAKLCHWQQAERLLNNKASASC